MRRSTRSKSAWPSKSHDQAHSLSSRRGTLAVLLSIITTMCLVLAFLFAKDTRFLMPGPLASAHVAIENCDACHTSSGDNNLSWVQGLVTADQHSDSKACLNCHKMPNTAFNPHGASDATLKQRTERLEKVAARTPTPQSAHVQSVVFPTRDMVARGINCAACHQEHQGSDFDLKEVADEQCRACHVVKFDGFDGHHPSFANYPFKRRTRIIYDHASHFGKHYPELAKKDPARRFPKTCSTCHEQGADKRVMSVTPFDQTCSSCHLDQITGKERISGPKGIAFLSLPGIDVETLRQKKAPIGEWPDDSEAGLTPFMEMMISRSERGRSLIKTVQSFDLQDLGNASDAQIKAVTNLVWEIKGLFYELIKGKASGVLADLSIGDGKKLSPSLIGDLTAGLPRDVVVRAHQQWLPNLATEMANRQDGGGQQQSGWTNATVTSNAAGSAPPKDLGGSETQPDAGSASAAIANPLPDVKADPQESPGPDSDQATPSVNPQAEGDQTAGALKDDGQACVISLFGQCMLFQNQETNPAAAEAQGAAGGGGDTNANFLGGPAAPRAGSLSPATKLGRTANGNRTQQKGEIRVAASDAKPGERAANPTDKLLFPSEEEIRALGARAKEIGNPGQPVEVLPNTVPATAGQDASSPAGAAASGPRENSSPVTNIQSDVDAETWAEYGGWYQQDYAVFYRPKGHKDKFIYSWLVLTGPLALQGVRSPAAAVFGVLTSKDAQGSCTKCHSVDTKQGKGRLVNFSPPSVDTKQGKFTHFVHEPHLSIMDDRGCLTCHNLEKGRPYLKSYEKGDPLTFVSNFGEVKKDLCQTCHTSAKARQDCLLCHNYHVNGVVTPTINTRIPAQ